MRKSAAALLLGVAIGERFDAIVTGASAKGTWVRILEPARRRQARARSQGLDVGDRVRVDAGRAPTSSAASSTSPRVGVGARVVMERRAFLGTLVAGLLARPLAAGAQVAGKVYRVGYLAASSPSAENTRLVGAFQAELRERGWVERQNIAFEYRWAEGHYERLPALAAELTEAKVDLIVAGGTPNAMAAQGATRVIPIVMVGATTPVELGLVNSLARPGATSPG